LGNG